MGFERWSGLAAFTLVAVVGCSQGENQALLDEADASMDSPLNEPPHAEPGSPEARAVLARLDAGLAAMMKAAPVPPSNAGVPQGLAPSPSPSPVRLIREGAWLRVGAEAFPRGRGAEVALPVDGRGAFRIADKQSGLEAYVSLRGASEAEAEIIEGQVVYRQSAAAGLGDVVHRPSAEGTEDFIVFDKEPPEEALSYQVTLGASVAGLRLVENTLELVDERGAPRLRVAAPYVVDSEGRRHDATLSVEGCSVDTNPAAPWGREPIAPGASQCIVQVDWGGQGVSYPAVVDPTWTTTGSMTSSRSQHTATLLASGKVLVAGGYNGSYLSSAMLFDPSTNTWATTGAMTVQRYEHTATLLNDGRVLAAGGYYYYTDSLGTGQNVYLTSANLYNPATGTWSATGNMKSSRQRHIAALLNNGSVLVAGGQNGATLATAEVYDVSTGGFEQVGNLLTQRQNAKAATLSNGKVLVVAGYISSSSTWLSSVELYDPIQKKFESGPAVPGARSGHEIVLLANGRALVTGGYNGTDYPTNAEIYNPITNSWTSTSSAVSRSTGTLTLLDDGRVLAAGGYASTGYLTSAQLYDPESNSWLPTVSLNTSRRYHTATRLPSGNVLVAGGYNGSYLSSSEVFTLPKPCTQNSQCSSGFCVDGYCCDSACDGPCNQCDQAGSEGNCRVKASGSSGRWSCAPYMCNGSTANCPSSCSVDSQCMSGYFCNGGSCVPSLPQGSVCTKATQCASGSCSDGFCCDKACSGACDVCSASLGAVPNGTCTNLPATTACGQFLCTGSSGACPVTCTSDSGCVDGAFCDANGKCTPKLANGNECTAGNQCTSALCVDGYCCNDACAGGCERCDIYGALGKCVTASVGNPGSPSCSPYVCNGSSASCPSSCASDAQCATNAYCDNGVCNAKRVPGSACAAAKQCQSGYCTGGICCDKACTGTCETCLAAQGASANGACTNLPAGTANCGNTYVCNGSSGACPSSCTNDASCASGLYCNSSQQCVPKVALGTACTGNSQCTSGNCVDGFCCNAACAGGCDRCNLPGSVGTCKVVDSGTVGANPSCGAYVCNGLSNACPTSCISDAQCASGGVCLNGQCEAKRALGQPCTIDKSCTSGACVDGVCCNSACNGGGCDRCDLPGFLGTCKIAPLGHAGGPGSCSPYLCDGVNAVCPSSCSGDANCESGHGCVSGICEKKKANGESCTVAKDCASGFCALGICCDSACTDACARCDVPGSVGTCGPAQATTPGEGCGLYLCNGKSTSCPSGCEKNEDCQDGYCFASACYPKRDAGSACDGHAECKSGFCVDGICCESACDGQCAQCNLPGSLGKCQAVTGDPVGNRPACGNDGSSCGGACDGVNQDVCSYPSAATPCGDGQASCTNGVMTYPAACDGKGACIAKTESCAPYACGPMGCLTGCSSDDDCGGEARCVEGQCKAPEAPDAGGPSEPAEPLWEGDADEGSCGCEVVGKPRQGTGWLLAGVAAVVAMARRRRMGADLV